MEKFYFLNGWKLPAGEDIPWGDPVVIRRGVAYSGRQPDHGYPGWREFLRVDEEEIIRSEIDFILLPIGDARWPRLVPYPLNTNKK